MAKIFPATKTFPMPDGGFVAWVAHNTDWHGSAIGRATHATSEGAAMGAWVAFAADVESILTAIAQLPATALQESTDSHGNGTWGVRLSAAISPNGRVMGIGTGPTVEAARAAAWRDLCDDRRKALAIFGALVCVRPANPPQGE